MGSIKLATGQPHRGRDCTDYPQVSSSCSSSLYCVQTSAGEAPDRLMCHRIDLSMLPDLEGAGLILTIMGCKSCRVAQLLSDFMANRGNEEFYKVDILIIYGGT